MGNIAGVKRDFKGLEKRRLKGLKLRGEGIKRSEVARRLGVTRHAVRQWEKQVEEGGKESVLWNGRAGRLPRLTESQVEELTCMLIEGPMKHGFDTPIWTCRRVAKLIEKKFWIHYHPNHVWKILRRIGFSVQKPIRRAKERDEKAISSWKKRRWLKVKKKPKKSEER
ncbi:winged helix-turn-helix domain-containing protein [Leptospira noguchii]|uniref:Homeodomain-like domain protein n=1 Tax=Leptospira noguchii TaxID=28182 RepID=M6VL80_9LEPT|nr:winged helix-turn-helix domain-containing protein [Leptospira noguchii]EMO53844.1 homeodomain-like domain protein [Leptospira noguchii]